jgi:hypothetical protein
MEGGREGRECGEEGRRGGHKREEIRERKGRECAEEGRRGGHKRKSKRGGNGNHNMPKSYDLTSTLMAA